MRIVSAQVPQVGFVLLGLAIAMNLHWLTDDPSRKLQSEDLILSRGRGSSAYPNEKSGELMEGSVESER